MPNNSLNDTIEKLTRFKDTMRLASEQTEDVKTGDATPEDERQDPSYILYDAIADSSINILKLPTIETAFNNISEKLGDDVAKLLTEIIVISMTYSAHNAITFYDALLKDELSRQFDLYGDSLNACIGTVNAHDGVLKVFKKQLDDISKQRSIDMLSKN